MMALTNTVTESLVRILKQLSIFLLLMINLNLLRGNFKCHAPHVDLNVGVNTGDDEEDPRAPRSSRQQPAQPEDDGPLVLLDKYWLVK